MHFAEIYYPVGGSFPATRSAREGDAEGKLDEDGAIQCFQWQEVVSSQF
jgi:hypothetical protein